MEEEIIQDTKLNEEEEEGEDVDHSSQASPFFLQMNLLLLLWASASSFEEIMDASHEYSDVMKNEEAIKSELGKKPTRPRRERIQIKEMVQRRPKFQTRINKDPFKENVKTSWSRLRKFFAAVSRALRLKWNAIITSFHSTDILITSCAKAYRNACILYLP